MEIEATANSPDLAVAAARLRQARAMAQEAGAARFPLVDVKGDAGITRQSLNLGFPRQFTSFLPQGWNDDAQLTANLAFDIDLWQRNRAALAAATSDATAAALDAEQARLLLTTGLALAYFDLAYLFELRDIRMEQLDIRMATQRLIAHRHEAGLETRASLRQSDAEVAAAYVALGAADERLALRRNQIAALLGAGPDRGLAISRPTLLERTAGQGLPAQATTDLVGRRPDIMASRRRMEAAASRVDVARADFFPAIRLDALFGFQSLGIANLFKQSSSFGSVGPAINLPVFHGGALRGRYDSASGRYDEAVALYNAAVVAAYQQVADTVTKQRLIGNQLDQARSSLKALEEAYSLQLLRYRGGLSTYLDVLVVEDRLLLTREAVAQLAAAARSVDIELIRALGGGFASVAAQNEENRHD